MQNEDKAVLSTLVEYLRSLNMDQSLTNPSLKYDPDAFSVFTGLNENLYNSVFLKHPSDNLALIKELNAIQHDLKLPLTAWVTADTDSPQLGQLLNEHYQSPGSFYGMLLDLNKANLSTCPSYVSIEQVKNQQQAEEYSEVFSKTFNFPNLRTHTTHWASNQYKATNPSGLSYIAKVDGIAAGVCSLMFNNVFHEFKTGGLYNACVLPEFRKRGIGTAMACHRINVAKEMGLEYLSIVLMSTAMARGYCERLGFTNYQSLTPYYIQP